MGGDVSREKIAEVEHRRYTPERGAGSLTLELISLNRLCLALADAKRRRQSSRRRPRRRPSRGLLGPPEKVCNADRRRLAPEKVVADADRWRLVPEMDAGADRWRLAPDRWGCASEMVADDDR